MNSTKINWFLLGLFVSLTALFIIILINNPANGENTLSRVGNWLSLIACVIFLVVQVSEIRRKNKENK